MRYAVHLTNSDGAYVVACRDLPSLNSVGDSIGEALREAADAMALVLQGHIDERQPIPVASDKQDGEYWVSLPAADAAKVGLYQVMLSNDMSSFDLTALLKMEASQVDHLLTLTEKSDFEQVEEVLAGLGYQIRISVEPSDC